MKHRLDLHEGVIISVIVFTLVAIFLPGKGMDELVLALLSVSSFLFGIFMAFSVSDRHSRQKEVRATLKYGDAYVVNLYKLAEAYSGEVGKKTQKLLDNWLVDTFDYFLHDFHKTLPKFYKLFDYIINLNPQTKKQHALYDEMITNLQNQVISNKKVRYLVHDKISRPEWISILTLAGVIIFCLFFINTNTFFSILLVVLLSTTLVTIVMVLRDLDSLFWKEQKWVWDPAIDMFNEIGTLPYIPQVCIDIKRVKVEKGLKYRSADYPHPYPNMKGKKVKIRIAK
ncbi:hypothetical protein HOD38_02665 [archaeon]|jgi:hypothetical protein|nr:hypothetical protein [archaeon]MBT4397146.1 hypothetical protein [archaeon]MBT4441548.1 hypothetical protein [archaeon]